MKGTYTFKYQGILKDFDFDKIDRDTFPLMIDSDIFNIEELSDVYKTVDNYFGIELDDSKWGVSNFYLYKGKEYHLKREVLEDMFDRCELKSESHDELQRKIQEIEFNLNFQVSDISQIRFLKTQILILNQSLTDPQYYLLYARGYDTNEYKSWFDFFRSEQIENEEYEYIFRYLKGDKNYVPIFIEEIWEEYFFVKNLTDFCKKKIVHLERVSGIREADVVPDKISTITKNNIVLKEKDLLPATVVDKVVSEIFSDDREQLFKFIVSKSTHKNKAFFSYLYHYFSDNKYLLKNLKSSLKYNSYLIKNEFIDEFSRVIQRNSDDSGDEEKRMFKIFDEYRDQFIQKSLKEN